MGKGRDVKGIVLSAFLFLLVLLASSAVFVRSAEAANCASGVTCTSIANGNWGGATSTFDCGCTPVNGDTVIITNGFTITVNNNSACTNLTINSGGILSQGTKTLTVSGNYTNNGTHSGSAAMTLSGAGATIDGTGSITNTGTLTLSANKTIAATANLGIAGLISISNGVTITNNGAINSTGTGISGGATSSWINAANSTLNVSGTLMTTGVLTASAVPNTVNYAGAAQTVKVTNFNNLILSGSGAKSLASGTLVAGNLSIAPSGTATASVSAGANLSVHSLTLGGLGTINGTWGYGPTPIYKDTVHFANTTGYLTVATDSRTNQAILTAVVTPSTVVYGSTANLSTTGGSGSGAVTYSAGASTGCSVAGSVLSVTNAGGTCSVTATKAADNNYNAATSAASPVTLNKATPTVSTWPTATAITYGQTLASSTLSGGSASVPGSFAFTTPSTAPNAGTASQSVTFTPTATANYNTVAGSVSVTVGKATATVTLGNLSQTYDNTPKSATATTVPAGLTVDFTYNGLSSAPSAIGSYTVVGTVNDSNYQGSATGTMEITPGALHHFLVEAAGGGVIAPQTAGTSFDIRITAQDSFNNTVTGFTGTVQITSSGDLVGSPVTSSAFTAGVLGSQSVTIDSSGTGMTLTAGNVVSGTSNGFTVNAAGINNFLIEAAGGGDIAPQTAGAPFDIRITARDQFHNTITGFSGVVALTTNAGAITPDSVTFTGGEGGVLTVNNVTVTLAGTNRNITAASGPDSSTSNDFTVNPGGVGNFLVEADGGGSLGPQTVGAPFNIQITARDQYNNIVTGFSGTVALTTNAGTITPGSVTFIGGEGGVLTGAGVTVTLAGTNRYITATFGSDTGDSNTFTVNGASTSVIVSPSIDPSTYGQTVDLTATVGSSGGTPTGDVDFRDGGSDCSTGTLLGTSTLVSGSATLSVSTLNTGPHTVMACYLGDSNFNAGDATVVLTVDKADQTTLSIIAPLSLTYGDTATLSTTGGSGTGTVTYSVDASTGCSVAGSILSVTDAGGSCSVTATKAADTDYNAATSPAATVTLTKADPSVTTWPSAGDIIYGQTLASSTLSGGSASIGGAFAFTTPGTTPSAGTASQGVTFTPADTTNYNTATGSVSVTVGKATATVVLNDLTQTYTGGPLTPTASTTPNGLSVIWSGAPETNAGSYSVTATVSDSNYQGGASGTFTVNKATTTITWGDPADITYGTALSATQLNATASVPGTFIYTPPSGTVLTAGSGQTLSVNFTPADTSNHSSTSKNVTINVIDTTPPDLSVSTLPDGSWTGNVTLNISGTASDAGSGLQVVTVNGSAVTVNPDGSFSTAITLLAGANTITVVATDNSGLTTTDTRTINYDGTAPLITITEPADNSATRIGSTTISGSVDANSTVTVITDDNGTVSNFTFNAVDGSFSADVSLGVGLNTITVNAADLAGNTSTAIRTVRYDDVNPSVAITNPGQDINTGQGAMTIGGTAGDDVMVSSITLTVNGTPASVTAAGGTFTSDVTFTADGTYAIVVTAADEAGNTSSATRNIIYDATAPVTTANPVSGTYLGTQSVTLSCSDTGTGCAGTKYCVGSGCVPAIDYTLPIAISTVTDLRFFSTDNAGNGETVRTASYVIRHTVNGSTEGNGGITCASPVNDGDTTTCTLYPDPGYHSVSASADICGGSLSGNIFTTGAVTSNCTVTASFAHDAINGACGLSNGGTFNVAPSTNLCSSGTASAVSGSGHPWSWTCPGQYGGADSGCTANIQTYTISASAGPNGSVSPSGAISVDYGASQGFTIHANTGYQIADVLVDGGSVGAVASYAFHNVNAGHTISAAFVDTAAPSLTVTAPLDGSWTSNNLVNVTGEVSASGGGLQSLTVNGSGVTPQSDNSYSAVVSLTQGSNTITVMATDYVGKATTVTLTVNYDPNAPVITIAAPVDNSAVKVGSTTISGSVDEYSSATGITDDNGTVTNFIFNAGDGTFSANVALGVGLNAISVNAMDLAGNTSTSTRTVRYDNVNPSVAVTSPGQDTATNQSTMTIGGTAGDDVMVSSVTMTVNGTPVSVTAGGGTFTADVTFAAEGTYAIVVTATDEAGNTASATRNVIYDTTGPVTIATPPGGTYSGAQNVTLSCVDATGAGCAGTKYCLGTGCTPTTDYTAPIMMSGSNDLRFFSTDDAGNIGQVRTESYVISTAAIPIPDFGYSLGNPDTLTVNVDASASTCRGASTNCGSYDWNWGDGTSHGTGVTASHSYAAGGTSTITLTVTDAIGGSAMISKNVTAIQPNRAPIAAIAGGYPVQSGWTVTVKDNSTDPDGNLGTSSTAITVMWGDGSYSRCAPGGILTHTYTIANTYTLSLSATDVLGLKSTNAATASVTIAMGSVSGTVENASGAGINLAKVTITVEGSIKSAYTNSSGIYTISNVKPGTGYPMSATYGTTTFATQHWVTSGTAGAVYAGPNTVNFTP